jgi:hypothetical protein
LPSLVINQQVYNGRITFAKVYIECGAILREAPRKLKITAKPMAFQPITGPNLKQVWSGPIVLFVRRSTRGNRGQERADALPDDLHTDTYQKKRR